MCSYCGCQALTVIRLLSVQHEEIINKLGQVRRSSEIGAFQECKDQAGQLCSLLAAHNALEEDGLFQALVPDEEFNETLEKLRTEHAEIDVLVRSVIAGEISVIEQLETLLRNNISNEENGLFPASAVTLDGNVWDQIEATHGIT